jgi:hypothetical protein
MYYAHIYLLFWVRKLSLGEEKVGTLDARQVAREHRCEQFLGTGKLRPLLFVWFFVLVL